MKESAFKNLLDKKYGRHITDAILEPEKLQLKKGRSETLYIKRGL
jgi:hypothetical protein